MRWRGEQFGRSFPLRDKVTGRASLGRTCWWTLAGLGFSIAGVASTCLEIVGILWPGRWRRDRASSGCLGWNGGSAAFGECQGRGMLAVRRLFVMGFVGALLLFADDGVLQVKVEIWEIGVFVMV